MMSPRAWVWGLGLVLCVLAIRLAADFAVPYPLPAAHGVVVVTGASTGIGRDACLAVCGQGFTCVGVVRDRKSVSLGEARQLHPECDPEKRVVLFEADVTAADTPRLLQAFVRRELEARGLGLAAVVNNAGVSYDLPIELVSEESVRATFEVNFFAVYRILHAFIPDLRAAQGRIITVGSLAGVLAAPGQGVYAATKHALEGMHTSMRRELLRSGVSVSMIDPGCTQAAIFKKSVIDADPYLELSAPDRAKYEWLFTFREKLFPMCEKYADHPSVSTSVDIVHALTSRFPRPRYFPANYARIPIWILAKSVDLVPERFLDLGQAYPQ